MGIKFWNVRPDHTEFSVEITSSLNPHRIGIHRVPYMAALVVLPGEEGFIDGILADKRRAPFHHDHESAWVFGPEAKYTLSHPELFNSKAGKKIVQRHEGTEYGVNIRFTPWIPRKER